jgi:hypothetical protein
MSFMGGLVDAVHTVVIFCRHRTSRYKLGNQRWITADGGKKRDGPVSAASVVGVA